MHSIELLSSNRGETLVVILLPSELSFRIFKPRSTSPSGL